MRRFIDCFGARHGAAVAFYAAFSMAPMLVVVTALLVWLFGDQSANATMIDAIQRLLGESEARALSELLAQAPHSPSSLLAHERASGMAALAPLVAAGSTLIGATGVFVELRSALQAMLGEPVSSGSWWRLVRIRLLSMGVVLGCGFLLAVAMLLQTVALLSIRWLLNHTGSNESALAPLLQAIETLGSWGVVTALFALLMRWLPDGRLPMRHAAAGASVAALLFMIGRYGIDAYITGTALRSTLGAAGSFAALLVWIYWSCQIFLWGAALAVEMGCANGKKLPGFPDTPTV